MGKKKFHELVEHLVELCQEIAYESRRRSAQLDSPVADRSPRFVIYRAGWPARGYWHRLPNGGLAFIQEHEPRVGRWWVYAGPWVIGWGWE